MIEKAPKIEAYKLANVLHNGHITYHDLFKRLKGSLEVLYQDGVSRVVHSNVVSFSALYWALCLKYNIAITSELCFSVNHADKIKFSTKSGRDLGESITRQYREMYGDISQEFNNNLYVFLRDLAVVQNTVHNLSIEYAAGYVATVSISDFVKIADDPLVNEKKDRLRKTWTDLSHNQVKASVSDIIETSMNSIRNNYSDSVISTAVEAGLIKENQLMQVVGTRGVTSDVDRSEFRKPIIDSFTEGIHNLADSHAEIKTAASSIEASGSDLEDSETANRLIQMVAMTLKRVHFTDCGSTATAQMYVRDKKELQALEGCYFLDPSTRKPIRIKRGMDLVGHTLNIRNPLSGCAHSDEHGICVVCGGDMLSFIPHGANVGHRLAAPFNAVMSQGILSKKHFSGSAAAIVPKMGEGFDNWFTFDKDIENILYKKKKGPGSVNIIIQRKNIYSLSVLFSQTPLDQINYSSMAAITSVVIEQVYDDTQSTTSINVTDSNRKPSFTKQLVAYIRENPNRLNIKDGKFLYINMDEWDNKNPLFSIPMLTADMAVFSKQIKSIIHSAGGSRAGAKPSPMEVLGILYDTVKDQVSVNYSTLWCLIYAYCAKNPNEQDYRLPKLGDEFHLLSGNRLIPARSLAGASAFQGMANQLQLPSAYLRHSRVESVFDYSIFPSRAHEALDKMLGL